MKAADRSKNRNLNITLVEFDTDNRFIQDLLIEYYLSQHECVPRIQQMEFFKRFAESLDYQLPIDIYGFNAATLLKQETFFAAVHFRTELENRYFYQAGGQENHIHRRWCLTWISHE